MPTDDAQAHALSKITTIEQAPADEPTGEPVEWTVTDGDIDPDMPF